MVDRCPSESPAARLMADMAPTTGSANLLIQRSCTRRIGTGLRKWRFSRPTFTVVTRSASSSTPRCFMTPNRVMSGSYRTQLTERLAIALEEPVQQHPPTRVGERPEDRRRRSVTPRTLCDLWSHVKRISPPVRYWGS